MTPPVPRPRLRWEGDGTGHGVAAATAFVPDVRRLLDTMCDPQWVTEDPEVHLLPHIRAACAEAPSRWRLLNSGAHGTVYQVDLEWSGAPARIARLRADAYALIGLLAETTSAVVQHVTPDAVDYDVTTGILDGDLQWRGHGHLLRLHITGRAVRLVIDALAHTARDPAYEP